MSICQINLKTKQCTQQGTELLSDNKMYCKKHAPYAKRNMRKDEQVEQKRKQNSIAAWHSAIESNDIDCLVDMILGDGGHLNSHNNELKLSDMPAELLDNVGKALGKYHEKETERIYEYAYERGVNSHWNA